MAINDNLKWIKINLMNVLEIINQMFWNSHLHHNL